MCSPSRSGMPSRNELAAEQGGRDETGRDARARRRRSPRRSRGFSPSHGDGAHGGNQETGRRPTRPGSTQRPAALCRDETGSVRQCGYDPFAEDQSTVVVRAGQPCAPRRRRPGQGRTVDGIRSTSGLDGTWFTVRAWSDFDPSDGACAAGIGPGGLEWTFFVWAASSARPGSLSPRLPRCGGLSSPGVGTLLPQRRPPWSLRRS